MRCANDRNTASAMGERQMLPMHTKRTRTGAQSCLFWLSIGISGVPPTVADRAVRRHYIIKLALSSNDAVITSRHQARAINAPSSTLFIVGEQRIIPAWRDQLCDAFCRHFIWRVD